MREYDDSAINEQLFAWVDLVTSEVPPVTASEAIERSAATSPAWASESDRSRQDVPHGGPPPYVLPSDRVADRSQPTRARRLVAAAGIAAVAAVGAVAVLPSDSQLNHLINDPEQNGPPGAAPPAEMRQDMLETVPSPDGVVAGGEILVTPIDGFDYAHPTTGENHFLSGNRGVTARWERWTGTDWNSTHILTAADFGPMNEPHGERLPTPDPLVQTYAAFYSEGQFTTLEAYGVEAQPFRFRIPDVEPGVYRFCFADIQDACVQIRFAGPDVPELANPNHPAGDNELPGHPGRTSWRLTAHPAEDAEVEPEATTITVYADQSTCPDDLDLTGSSVPIIDPNTFTPTVESFPDRLVITVRAEVISDGRLCAVAGSPRPLTVALGEPLGARILVDGGCSTGAADRPDCADGEVRWTPSG